MGFPPLAISWPGPVGDGGTGQVTSPHVRPPSSDLGRGQRPDLMTGVSSHLLMAIPSSAQSLQVLILASAKARMAPELVWTTAGILKQVTG